MKSLQAFLALYGHQTKRALVKAAACSGALSVLDFVSLLVLYPVLAAVLAGSDASRKGPEWLTGIPSQYLLLAAMVLMIVRSAAGFWVRWWWGKRVADAEVALGARIIGTYAFAPYSFHLRTNSADLLARSVAHVNVATASSLSGLVVLAGDAMSAAAVIAALVFANAQVALITAIFLACIGLLISTFSRKLVRRETAKFTHEVAGVYERAALVLRGIRELTVSNARGVALHEMDRSRTGMAHAQRKLLILNEVPRLVLEVVLYLAILSALIVVIGSPDPVEAFPLLALYVVAGTRLLPIVIRVLSTQMSIRSGFEIGRLLASEVASIESLGHQARRPAGPLPERGILEIKDVYFEYEHGRQILRGANLEVPFGSMIGVVGPSGSGKTTLIALLLGLLPPQRGGVSYGGVDIGLADSSWLSKVAYVPQDVFLLDDTLLANVALGDPHPCAERASDALERAHLSSVVDGLPEGLNTRLQEGGTRLSVGQRQRVGIARALYRDAKLLLLDEPTAALDLHTEIQVMSTLEDLRGDVTMLIVAHRLSTLTTADRIVTLERGTIDATA